MSPSKRVHVVGPAPVVITNCGEHGCFICDAYGREVVKLDPGESAKIVMPIIRTMRAAEKSGR